MGQALLALVVGLSIIALINVLGCAAINYLHSLDKITEGGCVILSTSVQIAAAYIAYIVVTKVMLNDKKE